MPSVTSNISMLAGAPVLINVFWRRATKSFSMNCLGLMFTLNERPLKAGLRAQSASVLHAVVKIHSPMSTMAPDSSAKGMNSTGPTCP